VYLPDPSRAARTHAGSVEAFEAMLRRSREEIRELALAASTAREQEKSRVARELHDELGQALTAFKIDWTAIDRRRRADMQKLESMQQYAYTKGCRRGFVLRYFGDPAARTTCGGCDNCLDVRVDVEAGAAPSLRGQSKSKRGATPKREIAPEDMPVLSGADEALLARLRDLRRNIAREDQVPAYVVFPDRTLAEMAVKKPTNAASLGKIRGVGPVKLDKYGERFLEVLRSVDETEAA